MKGKRSGPSAGATRQTASKVPFDDALKKLEGVVAKLEAGDLSLEDSIRLFEEGVHLSRICSLKLEEAEGKVEMLVREQEGKLRAVPFSTEDPEGGENPQGAEE